jgi:hypothetical protein
VCVHACKKMGVHELKVCGVDKSMQEGGPTCKN